MIGVDQIKFRSEAIGIRLKRLAQMAGVDPGTAYKAAKDKSDPRLKTVRALLETLERQEDRVRRHLKDVERAGGGRQMDIFSNGGKAA